MNRLFLADSVDQLKKCYTPEQIGNSLILSTDSFYQYAMSFQHIEYLFSTWGMPEFSEREIRKYLPSLKAVFYGAGSVSAFARPFLNCGVRIFSAWEANAIPTAEFAAAQIVLANKGYFQLPVRYQRDYQSCVEYADSFPGNYHTRIGLLGMGQVSRHVMRLLQSYQLEILVYSRHLTEERAAQIGVKKAELNEIFSSCQVISNHLANKPEMVSLLDEQLFRLMIPNATFINTGRGAQVNLEGLKRVMRERPDCTALLDVTDPTEPLLPQDEIWKIPNILITPHRAGSTAEEILRLGAAMGYAYDALQNGDPCCCEVTLDMLDTMA